MKILDNGIIRDMTTEEEAAFIAANENNDIPDTEALDIILGGTADEA